MQFRLEIADQGKKDRNRQKHNKCMLCFFMVIVLTLSGCGSIILNGNLEFSANAPIQPLQPAQREKEMEKLTFGATASEKYNISGNPAFTILPGHLCPADIPTLNEVIQNYNANAEPKDKKSLYRADFKVIDYNENTGRFVYAYYTPYIKKMTEKTDVSGNTVMVPQATIDENFIELGNLGLAKLMEVQNVTSLSAARTGKATNFSPEHVNGEDDLDGGVLVLMSYDPLYRNYTVFLSTTYSASENAANDNRCIAGMAGMDQGIDESAAKTSGGMINENQVLPDSSKKNYYVFAHDHLYLFNEDGGLIYSSDYKAVIESKAKEMAKTYGNYTYSRYTVSNVEIDGKGIPYFTLDMEVSNKEFAKADAEAEEIINNDKDYEEDEDAGEGDAAEDVGGVTYFHGTFACLRANIGGTNGLAFMSDLTEDTLTALQNEEYTVSRNVVDYTTVRTSEEKQVEKTIEGNTPSENKTVMVTETEYEPFADTMSRLKASMESTDKSTVWSTTQAAKEQRDNYVVQKDVVGLLGNGFTEFCAGSGDVKYYLCGGATGREVNLKHRNSSQDFTFGFALNNYSYEEYYFLWFSKTRYVTFGRRDLQNRMIGALSGYLNQGYMMPALKPGNYPGLDWADYNIGNYAERNGQYKVTDALWIKGHAQPLVSSGYFSSGITVGGNRMVPETDGALWMAIPNPDEPSGFKTTQLAQNFQCSQSRYYYNRTLDTSFRIASGSSDWITSDFAKNQQFSVDTMLRDNLPYVLVCREYKESDTSTKKNYLPISNDDNYLYILPVMTLQKTQDITLKTNYYLRDEAGKEHLYYTREQKVTIPAQYKMEFPDKCFVQEMGDTWVGNRVKAADEELEALTYFSITGKRMAEDSIWKWYLRNDFPIYDNASNEYISSVETYHRWWGVYYMSNAFWNFYNGEDKDKLFTTVEVKRDGKNGLIYDRMVPGEAKDLGIWKVDGKNIVAVFTDQVVRFYKKDTGAKSPKFGAYRAVAEIRIDELRSLASAYMLKEEENNSSIQGSYGTHAMSERASEALSSDDGMYQLDARNILPVKGDLSNFLYFSADGGLHLLYLVKPPLSTSDVKDWHRQGRVLNLLEGTYYNVFAGKGSDYKVVGFQTQEFSYTGADLCMAKCYDLDLQSMVDKKNATAVQDYMTSLRNAYLTGTHTISLSVNAAGEVEGKVITPDSNNVDFMRGETLLTGEYAQAEALLDTILKEYGMESISDEEKTRLRDYLKKLRETFRTQRDALKEMYSFLGINSTDLSENWVYVQFEGRVFNGAYESILEETMIEIVLSQNYLDQKVTPRQNGLSGMVGIHAYDEKTDGPAEQLRFTDETRQYVDELAVYREQYKDWLKDNNVTALAVSAINDKELEQKISELTKQMNERNAQLEPGQAQMTMSDMMNKQETTGISGMDFYKATSDILEERYLKMLEEKEAAR